MLPGFVVLGGVAIAFQLAVIGGFFRYVRSRRPIGVPRTRRRLRRSLVAGATLAATGQFLALGAVGYVWVDPSFSFETMGTLVDVGVVAAVVGYLAVFATFVLHTRAASGRADR